MSVNMYRKCAKCGKTGAEDKTITYHRFPNPGRTNLIKAQAWAKYCWPNKDWTSVESLRALYIANKVICRRHFSPIHFNDNNKLNKFAVPDSTEVEELLSDRENIFYQNAEPSTSVAFHQITEDTQTTGGIIRAQETEQLCGENVFKCRIPLLQIDNNILTDPSTASSTQQSSTGVTGTVDISDSSESQLKNCPKKPKGRRYTLKQKIMALVIYKKSPSCYRLLRRMFALPSQRTLIQLLNKIPLTTGINKHIFNSLKKMAQKQKNEDNICVLSFDEIAIRKHLYYDSKLDELHGFQDHGNHGRESNVASKALVFMLHGLRKHWKQPIAFYFSNAIRADRMTVILKEILSECFSYNLNVVATVCDLSTVNIKVLKTLGVTTHEPCFTHCDREIISILDPPHLLKCTRNMLMKHDVECWTNVQCNETTTKGIVKWSHILDFYNLDKKNPNFVHAPLLTDHHLQPNCRQKMRVKLAAQVFSHSVTSGMLTKIALNELPTAAHTTATFIQKFDELFDAVNADTPDLRRGKKYSTNITCTSPHFQLFNEMRKFISCMKYIGSKNIPPSQDGWIHTMNGVEKLWKKLVKLNIKTLSTRKLNQDSLENFFGSIRYSCGSNDNPTVQQFISGIKTAIISNLKHCGQNKNCENDSAVLADNLSEFLLGNISPFLNKPHIKNYQSDAGGEIENLVTEAIETVEQATPEGQSCGYVCGFIYKSLQNKECVNCQKAFLTKNEETIHIFTSFKEYDQNKSLNYVNKAMVICVETMATLVNNYLKTNAYKKHLIINIFNLLECVDVSFLDQCEKHIENNVNHVKTCIFFICVKRFCTLKNREMDEDERKKALERKLRILKNK